jgi:hypothetical protein
MKIAVAAQVARTEVQNSSPGKRYRGQGGRK